MCFAFWDILDLGLSNLTHSKNTESTCMHETDGRIYYVAAGLASKAFISKTETCPQVGQVGQWVHHMFILCAKLLYVHIFVSNCKMYLSQIAKCVCLNWSISKPKTCPQVGHVGKYLMFTMCAKFLGKSLLPDLEWVPKSSNYSCLFHVYNFIRTIAHSIALIWNLQYICNDQI